MDPLPTLTLVLAVIVLYQCFWKSSVPKLRLPPGPPRLPFIGNILDIPSQEPWKQYAAWSKEYGSDLIYLDAAGTPIVVIHSMQTARVLFESRGAIYSSRPVARVANEIIGLDWLLALMPYSNSFREKRRLFQQFFHPKNSHIHQPMEQKYVHRLLGQLLITPQDFATHVRHMVGCIAIAMSYGMHPEPVHDPYVELSERITCKLAQAIAPSAFTAGISPVLNYVPEFLPGGGWKKRAKKLKEEMLVLKDAPFDAGMKELGLGTAAPSLLSCSLQNMEDDRMDKIETIKEVCGQTFMAGTDVTTSAIMTFILAMSLFPDVQREARAEVDRVVQERLPTHADQTHMPYIIAVAKETLRWQTPFPLGLPHLSTQDDVYKGHLIPRGSIVMANIRAMMYNQAEFAEPESFNPRRFLEDGKLNSRAVAIIDAAFGFGRRACPGQFTAESTLFLTMASILAVFDICKEVDADGMEITPPVVYGSGSVVHPLPFLCQIKPRSSTSVQVVQSLMKEETST